MLRLYYKKMKLSYQIWQATKYVDEFLKTYKPPQDMQLAGWIIQMYGGTDDEPTQEVIDIFKQAIDEGFLEEYSPDGGNRYLKTKRNLRVGARGRRLIDGFCGIPTGLINELITVNGAIVGVLVATGVLTVAIQIGGRTVVWFIGLFS